MDANFLRQLLEHAAREAARDTESKSSSKSSNKNSNDKRASAVEDALKKHMANKTPAQAIDSLAEQIGDLLASGATDKAIACKVSDLLGLACVIATRVRAADKGTDLFFEGSEFAHLMAVAKQATETHKYSAVLRGMSQLYLVMDGPDSDKHTEIAAALLFAAGARGPFQMSFEGAQLLFSSAVRVIKKAGEKSFCTAAVRLVRLGAEALLARVGTDSRDAPLAYARVHGVDHLVDAITSMLARTKFVLDSAGDLRTIVELLEKAVKLGSACASVSLARIYMNGVPGILVPKPDLAICYATAKNVVQHETFRNSASNILIRSDDADARAAGLEMYEFGVQQGDACAAFNLGSSLLTGSNGVKKDLVRARRLLQASASAGQSEAFFALLKLVKNGDAGFDLLKDASGAQVRLACMGTYENKEGIDNLHSIFVENDEFEASVALYALADAVDEEITHVPGPLVAASARKLQTFGESQRNAAMRLIVLSWRAFIARRDRVGKPARQLVSESLNGDGPSLTDTSFILGLDPSRDALVVEIKADDDALGSMFMACSDKDLAESQDQTSDSSCSLAHAFIRGALTERFDALKGLGGKALKVGDDQNGSGDNEGLSAMFNMLSANFRPAPTRDSDSDD